ncbi:DUF1653 domain-containing protein [Bacillus sp. FJAT-49736]|uniref:DUF1653 domain-containing protein n=1 Tax=Bacillus sp. FJAT-49736 TaxID=2833582 RepID=UPI001BC90B87|nr:DUF1653 domain-containing protein [Bacillus sp. FJAT-49736]MBS4173481.1 DUF1653 domain-containing protein [Bacillus sp. FJAT-49736]
MEINEKEQVILGGVYKHFKGGEYVIFTAGMFENTMEPCIVYQSLDTGKLWIRTYEDFTGYKEINGERVKRFEYIGALDVLSNIANHD